MPAPSPKNLIRHPIADSRKLRLLQQKGLQGSGSASLKEGFESIFGEAGGQDLRGKARPPIGRSGSQMKTDASEHAWIAENEASFPLTQDEVIVLIPIDPWSIDP